MEPRGIRNNNPLNIRLSKDRWQGQRAPSTSPKGEKTFCEFETMAYGWRTAFRLLCHTYYGKYKLRTIRAIINRWAPSSENNTSAYIANVSRLTGIDPDESLGIPLDKPSRWMMVGMAMAIQENGTSSIDWFAMLKGWEMCRADV